jgi:putative flippase GtrA
VSPSGCFIAGSAATLARTGSARATELIRGVWQVGGGRDTAEINRKRCIRTLVAKVVGFALVSGVGLALDFGSFLLLVFAGLRPGFANLVSATAAVTFVYFVSTKQVFDYQGRFLFQLFVVYLVYQALAVGIASWAVVWILAEWTLGPASAKLSVACGRV